jgi:hypothetical protein
MTEVARLNLANQEAPPPSQHQLRAYQHKEREQCGVGFGIMAERLFILMGKSIGSVLLVRAMDMRLFISIDMGLPTRVNI